MKKILVVTTKFPFPLYRGDNLRIYSISKHLSKKNKVDLIYTESKESFQKIKFFNKIIWIKTNNISRFFSIFYFVLKNKNLHYLKKTVVLIFFLLLFQVFLGVLTILSGAQIFVASFHQIGSIFLISSSLYLLYKNTNFS